MTTGRYAVAQVEWLVSLNQTRPSPVYVTLIYAFILRLASFTYLESEDWRVNEVKGWARAERKMLEEGSEGLGLYIV